MARHGENNLCICKDPVDGIAEIQISPDWSVTVIACPASKSQGIHEALIALDYNALDSACEDYSYKQYGQAFRIIDLLVAHGLAKFTDAVKVREKISSCLTAGTFNIRVARPKTTSPSKRQVLINAYADACGVDPDRVNEFIGDIELIDGFSVRTVGERIDVCFASATGDLFPFLSFLASRSNAYLFMRTDEIQTNVSRCGVFPFELEFLFTYLNIHIDQEKYKSYQSDTIRDVLFLDFNSLFDDARNFKRVVTQFMSLINQPEVTKI